jgi:hypothetical protein
MAQRLARFGIEPGERFVLAGAGRRTGSSRNN